MSRLVVFAVLLVACSKKTEDPKPAPTPGSGSGSGSADVSKPVPIRRHDAISRADFNRLAVRANLPVYWIADVDGDNNLDVNEVAALLFYPTTARWTADDKFTHEFEATYDVILAASHAPPPDVKTDEGKRQKLVGDDLDQGRAAIVMSDLSKLSADDKRFVDHMMRVAALVDELYDIHTGAKALAAKLPADAASRSLFRRNRGPKCVAPGTEQEPLCSAIPGAPKQLVDLYPAPLQADPKFCEKLDKKLLTPFTAVRGEAAALTAVPFPEAYKEQMQALAKELAAAADSIKDPSEAALVAYLRAASESFTTNSWEPADEAWAKMNVDNSKWYVRVGPDETYWEPCNQKAGVHLTFARINQGSREWQKKLVPVQQEMEAAIATRAGKPYAARQVTFHLPDFIDVVFNAGDDRDPLGATVGQSLPNWGKVADESRGRTIAMMNFYIDADSRAARQAQAEAMFDTASVKLMSSSTVPGLLGTILHEATHNLGPNSIYKLDKKSPDDLFTGPVAQVLEELKAQAGALFLIEMLREKKVISDELAAQSYVDTIFWAFSQASQGMYEPDKKRKTYPQVGAIQNGFLIEKGVLVWDAQAKAANGKDTGAFRIDATKLVAASDELMKLVAGIKARGDKAAAEALITKYVDGAIVPHAMIQERFLRHPKASFVYSVAL